MKTVYCLLLIVLANSACKKKDIIPVLPHHQGVLRDFSTKQPIEGAIITITDFNGAGGNSVADTQIITPASGIFKYPFYEAGFRMIIERSSYRSPVYWDFYTQNPAPETFYLLREGAMKLIFTNDPSIYSNTGITLIHNFVFDSLLNLTGSYDRTDTFITFDTTMITTIYRSVGIGLTNIINIEGSSNFYGADFYGIYEQAEYFPVEGDTAVFYFTF